MVRESLIKMSAHVQRFSLNAVVDAVAQIDRKGELRTEGVRLLRSKDRRYMAATGLEHAPHALFLDRIRVWLRFFITFNALLLPLSAAAFGLILWELLTIAVFPNAIALAVLTGTCACASAVALFASTMLRQDLHDDQDGKETPAQRLIEAYFWGMLVTGSLPQPA